MNRSGSLLRRSIAPALLVLACALGGILVSRGEEARPQAAPASSAAARDGSPRPELRAVKTFPAARAERMAVDQINERLKAINEDGDRIVLEAKQLRGIPATAELRWDQSSKDGGWILYEPVAPVGSNTSGAGVASQGSK